MEKQLSQKQWDNVVAEVTRLAAERETELTNRAVTQQVLQELNLPSDLMDEALNRLQYREAVQQQKRQRTRLAIISGLLILLLVTGFFFARQSHQAELAKIQAVTGRLTAAQDGGGHQSNVQRNGEEVFYRVKLQNVPAGERLKMSCNWIDPAGNIFAQNRWETKATNTQVWETFCRCRLGTAAPAGTWKVEMKVSDRVINVTEFKVE